MLKHRTPFAVAASLALSVSCIAQCSGHATLNQFERGQFIEVVFASRAQVYAQFLSEPGCGKKIFDALKELGARIDYSDDRSGYTLVTIARGKLLDTLDIAGIAYAYTRNDRRLYPPDDIAATPISELQTEPVPPIVIPYAKVATTLAHDGPYFAGDEIGLTQLGAQHPNADGRGVRVGVVDEGFDLLHPALQQARDEHGNIVPKVADIDTLSTPEEDSSWVRFGEPLRASNGKLEAAGHTWSVPADGTYCFGIFRKNLVLGPEGNSHVKKLTLAVGVLWNRQTHRVWVDTDGDHNFNNQRVLGDYRATHDVDWFGRKDGDNDNRIPFGIKIDGDHNAVYIRIGEEHGTFIAGSMAGNTLSGGLFDGAAPAAQLIDQNSARATLAAAVVKMFARPDVDVVNFSGGLGRGGYPAPDEGMEDFEQRVVERVMAVYDKPIATYSAALGAIHVNDYAGAEMLRRNRQIDPPYKDTLNSSLWWLPNGMVNTVIAPSANLETESRYMPIDLIWEDGKRRTFSDKSFSPPVPSGYVIGDNNSPTISIVSGIIADLISEAKREHIRYNAQRLNNALFTGARLLDNIPLSQQGFGLVNAAHSWQQLAKAAQADDPANPQLTSFTFAREENGKRVEVQGFRRDLPSPNESIDGALWITRRGGYAAGRRYTFALRGNDGTFTLLDHEATLIRDQPIRVRFHAKAAAGWRLDFLELRDVSADVVMQAVPLSVRAPEALREIAPGVDKYASTIAPLTSEYHYLHVGSDVQAVRYVMRIPYTGPELISTRFFPGYDYETTTRPAGEPVDAAHHVGPLETLESLVMNESPGNQEVFWENRGRPEYATQYDGPSPDVPIHAELTVEKYAVSIKQADKTLTLTNHLAAVRGRAELYNATLSSSTLTGMGTHASVESERILPANLVQWRLRITSNAPLEKPTDVYLLNCSGKTGCYVAAQRELSASSATLIIDKPEAGAWKIAIRSRDQASHRISYSVHDALLALDTDSAKATDDDHPHGSSWAIHLAPKRRDVQYAAFRIAGASGNADEKDGLLISMTPLDAAIP